MDFHCLSETPIISAQRDTCRYKLHFDFSLQCFLGEKKHTFLQNLLFIISYVLS